MKRFLDIVKEIAPSILLEDTPIISRSYVPTYSKFYNPNSGKDEDALGFNVKERWDSSDSITEEIFNKQQEFLTKYKEFKKKYIEFLKKFQRDVTDHPEVDRIIKGCNAMIRSVKLI